MFVYVNFNTVPPLCAGDAGSFPRIHNQDHVIVCHSVCGVHWVLCAEGIFSGIGPLL